MPESNPVQDNSFDEYDHDYETREVCEECELTHEDCDCEEFQPSDDDVLGECAECGLREDDPIHG